MDIDYTPAKTTQVIEPASYRIWLTNKRLFKTGDYYSGVQPKAGHDYIDLDNQQAQALYVALRKVMENDTDQS